jgi:Ca2+-binding RTX toxin-like protein
MAIGIATSAVNMNGSSLYDLFQVTFDLDGTGVFVEGTDGEYQLFRGSGITWDEMFNVTGGTVTEVAYQEYDTPIYTITGLNKQATTIAQYVVNDNKQGLLKYLFSGNDDLHGSSQNDVVNGYNGADYLEGNGGADKLNGGAGNDDIVGGLGKDTLTGGTGADWFFYVAQPTATTADVITDFSHAQADKIVLDNDFFAVGAAGAALGAKFYKAADITLSSNGHGDMNSADRILYDTDSGNLYYDSNGSIAGGRVLLATLTNHAVLVATDFLIGE